MRKTPGMLHDLYATAHKLTHTHSHTHKGFYTSNFSAWSHNVWHNSHLFKNSNNDVFVAFRIREDFDFILEGKMKAGTASDPPNSLVGLWLPTEATDMSFQRPPVCDRTPLEFRGTAALPVLIIAPFTVITLLSGWLWSCSSEGWRPEAYVYFHKGCDIPDISARRVRFGGLGRWTELVLGPATCRHLEPRCLVRVHSCSGPWVKNGRSSSHLSRWE